MTAEGVRRDRVEPADIVEHERVNGRFLVHDRDTKHMVSFDKVFLTVGDFFVAARGLPLATYTSTRPAGKADPGERARCLPTNRVRTVRDRIKKNDAVCAKLWYKFRTRCCRSIGSDRRPT
jgi:hypothetical protein